MSWADEEFNKVDLGDKRLNTRLIKLCDSFSEAPESSINQACEDWSEAKAAYRFFQNDDVNVEQIIKAHREKTLMRAANHTTILSLQDTSYFIYTNHPKTTGLGKIARRNSKDAEKEYSNGLIMHTSLAVTTQGVPLGFLDQQIFARKKRSEDKQINKRRVALPVEEKESYRWIEAMEAIPEMPDGKQIVTVCDRECDSYDFFKAAQKQGATFLVRAAQDRVINKNSRHAQEKDKKLWEHITSQPEVGSYILEISAIKKTKLHKGRTARTAPMAVKFGAFEMNPPQHNIKHKTEILPDMQMYAIQVLEKQPPKGEDPVEWMLLTNQPVSSMEDACEKVHWYTLRWRIEMFFKVLKSGFRVEACRLETADRLIRYLSVMSIVAWRLFMITLIARTNPSLPCTHFLSEPEWKVLAAKSLHKNCPFTISEAVISIAKLGGYLARKSDGPPGTLALWRGWKRLIDRVDGWLLACQL